MGGAEVLVHANRMGVRGRGTEGGRARDATGDHAGVDHTADDHEAGGREVVGREVVGRAGRARTAPVQEVML